jgi:manganese efflux pump family protein
VLALLLLAVALGLSNLAASIGIGVGGVSGRTRVRIAVVFGLFEAGMPVLGLVLGHGLADTLGQAARWLGGAALIAVGLVQGAGLVRSRPEGAAKEDAPEKSAQDAGERAQPQRIGRMLIGGLALSGDNLAAGFALGAYHVSVVVAATVFGLVSVAMSLAGLELGARIGTAAGDRSELIASALLIVVGVVIAAGAL